jgi:peptide/nickel transport system substrate-binding protein
MSEVKKLEQLLSQGKITRREFLARASALGLTAALSPALLTRPTHAATPKKGGHLRIGIGHGSSSDSLDPATSTDLFMANLLVNMRNNLINIDSDGKPIPELAESWESSQDLKSWTIMLKKGVEYHNGKTMEAEDVVASINHHRSEKSKSPAKVLLKPITELKTDGKHTVRLTLADANADLPYILSWYQLNIMPKKGDDVDWQSGVGTGAFILEKFEPGVEARLKRNPNYWDSGKPYFDQYTQLVIHDIAARTNSLKTGQIDVMDRCDLKTVHLLEKMPGIRVEEVTGYAHYSIPMLVDVPPFDNNDVRLALKYSVDREALLKTILRGHGAIGNDHPISTANRFTADELPQREYDPDKAKFHLKKAGYDKLTVPLHAADAAFRGALDVAVLYKEHAAKAGITIKVVREPDDGYWKEVWKNKPWCFCYWNGRPTEDWMFSTAYAADASWNDMNWKHERFNKLLLEARAERDEGKRREMYFEMQKIVRDEGGVVIPLFNNYVFACNDKLQHDGTIQGNLDLDGNKIPRTWWFA